MKPYSAPYGHLGKGVNSIEEMIYPRMEFISEAEANKYARWVLGCNCFAVKLTDTEIEEFNKLTKSFKYE